MGEPAPPAHRPPGVSSLAHRRGARGEAEVLRLWRRAAWPDAFRTPRSGGLRYDAGDSVPPFPLDIASGWPADYRGERRPRHGPWMVEVKDTDAMDRSSREGYPGHSFVRKTLREMVTTTRAVGRASTGYRPVPVLFARGAGPWRVWVPDCYCFAIWYDEVPCGELESFIELDPLLFFAEVALSVVR